jgi:hypothetical protein
LGSRCPPALLIQPLRLSLPGSSIILKLRGCKTERSFVSGSSILLVRTVLLASGPQGFGSRPGSVPDCGIPRALPPYDGSSGGFRWRGLSCSDTRKIPLRDIPAPKCFRNQAQTRHDSLILEAVAPQASALATLCEFREATVSRAFMIRLERPPTMVPDHGAPFE